MTLGTVLKIGLNIFSIALFVLAVNCLARLFIDAGAITMTRAIWLSCGVIVSLEIRSFIWHHFNYK